MSEIRTVTTLQAKRDEILFSIRLNAANRSADIAEASLVKLQRAFVFPREFFVKWHWHIDREPRAYFSRIRPIYENSGGTPTVDLVTNINCGLLDEPLPENFDFSVAPENFAALIGPKGQIMGGSLEIQASELIEIREGRKHFYIWGLLRYNDVFENSPEHVTTFCREVVGITGNPFDPTEPENPVNLFFAMTDRYNAAD